MDDNGCDICGAESVVEDGLCSECIETVEYEEADTTDYDSLDLVQIFERNR